MKRRNKKNSEMPLLGHIKELRKVFLIAIYAVAFGTVVGWIVSDYVYRFLADPITRISGVAFITTTPMEPVLVKLQVSVVSGVVIALPIILWQIWSFVMPGLKKNEKKYIYFIVPASVILFLGGAAFAYYGVLPICLKFLLFAGSSSVDYTPFLTKASYLKFILTFMIAFGVVFQLPVILLILMRLGFLSPKTLAKYRKWAFFAIVLLTVLLSPTPDLLTQFLMAGPMYLLYEISIWIGFLITREKKVKPSKKIPEAKASVKKPDDKKANDALISEGNKIEEKAEEARLSDEDNPADEDRFSDEKTVTATSKAGEGQVE